MQAITQRINSAGRTDSTVQGLPSGAAGTHRTLVLMHDLIADAQTSPAVLAAAAEAAGAPNRASTPRAEVARVQQWVQQNIRYVKDPELFEVLRSPELTLQRRSGDCDDQTSLMCALLTALGYKCRMVAVGFTGPGVFAHVLTEVLIGDTWTAAETIRPWPLGKKPPNVKATMPVLVNVQPGAAQLSGLLKSLKKVVKVGVKYAVPIAAGIATGGATGVLTAAGGIAKQQQDQAAAKAAAAAGAPVYVQAPASPAPAAGGEDFGALVNKYKVPLGGLALVVVLLLATGGRR